MGRLLLLLLLIHLALAFAAIVDCYGGAEKPARLSRLTWSLIAVLGVLGGPIAWFAYGRPGRRLSLPWNEPGPARPLAPDDDPEFLADLARRAGPPPKPEPERSPPKDLPHVETDTNDIAPEDRNNGAG
ncbi:MAG TPA: hypothetical protein VFZ32_17195 [Micromonosporaceae bacterium]